MANKDKNKNIEEGFDSKMNINCEEWANAKPSRKVDLPTFFA